MTVIDIPTSEFASALGIGHYEPIIPARELGEDGVSPSEDEYKAICALLAASNPSTVFEFGTCIGGSTRVLAMNAEKATIFSLDLYEPRQDPVALHERRLALNAQVHPAVLVRDRSNVRLLRGDSRTYDLSAIPPCDFIFIDGGHDYGTVKSDTYRALLMLNRSNPDATIVWHDCNNPATPDVTRLTNELSETRTIFGAMGYFLRFYISKHDALGWKRPAPPSEVVTL